MASIEPLSSWEGPGTSYTVTPRATVPPPVPVEPPVPARTEEPDALLPPCVVGLRAAEARLLEPAPKPSANWPLMAGAVFGTLLTALLIVLWHSWATYSAPGDPASSAASASSPEAALHSAPRTDATYGPDNASTVTQEPLDDGALAIPPSEPVPEELSAPSADNGQLPSDADTPAQASTATAEAQASATLPLAAATAPAPPVRKRRPIALTSTLAGKKHTGPLKQRSATTTTATGNLTVAVQPWGEVWIDGCKRGITPPLFKLQLPPGNYLVELRNPGLPSYSQKLQISAGQSVTLRHSFQ